MQTLSRNKKIGIFSLVILGITLIGFIWTENVDMSRLSSSVLNGSTYICTENGQKRNLNEYNKAIRDKQQAEGKIKIMSGEINVLKKTIEGHKKTIASHEETIKKQNTTISELAAYISKNCTNPKTSREKTVCTQKKQQKTNLEQSNKNLSNQITSLNTLIGRLEWQIKQKNENITTWTKKIEEYTKYIKEYDACTESLKGKLIITSPLMSGEVTMPNNEIVVLHTSTVTVPKDLVKVQMESIDYTLDIKPAEGLSFWGWHIVSGLGSGKCNVVPGGEILLVRCPVNFSSPYLTDSFIYPNNPVEYILKWSLPRVEFPGTIVASLVGIKYNGWVDNIDNQTASTKMAYSKSNNALICNDSDERNGNEGKDIFTRWFIYLNNPNIGNNGRVDDYCSEDGKSIIEAHCGNIITEGTTSDGITLCPNGCKDGACLSISE